MRNRKIPKLMPIIFFVQLLAIHLVNYSLYCGVIKTWLFDIAIIVLFLSFVFIKEFGKRKFIGFMMAWFLILFIFVFNLPSTTYEDGKAILQNEINSDKVAFISTDYKRIPTAPLKQWFIEDYYYYYEVEVLGQSLFYAVSPVHGFSFQLEEDFFRYNR